MDLIQAIVYGALQGLTEFLPISSTAHVRIAPSLLGWSDPGAAFTAAIQLGTLAAILSFFWRDLVQALSGWSRGLLDKSARDTQSYRMGWAVFIGTVPISILGFAFKDWIETSLRSLYVVAISLIVFGLLLAVADRIGRKVRSLESVNLRDGLLVGMFQALALVPGCSRSGSTITGAMFGGFNREAAARFSFLLSIPSILIAGIFSIASHWNEMRSLGLAALVVANLVSFVLGYASIAYLMRFLQTKSLLPFVIYRVALGTVILILLSQSVLKPL